MKKFLKKNKVWIILLIIFIILLIGSFFIIKNYVFGEDIGPKYGNRLDDISSYKISSAKIEELKKLHETKVEIQGKIINFTLTTKETYAFKDLTEKFKSILEQFTEEEQEYYDFQFFYTNEGYSLIGYKSNKSTEISYSETKGDLDEKK